MVQSEIVDHQQISSIQPQLLVAHPKLRRSVQWEEQFEPFMPGGPARVLSRSIMKELDDKRELPAQFQLVPPPVVQLARDVVRFKAQSITNPPQTSKAVTRVANNLMTAAFSQTNRRYRAFSGS
jgi:hypothetical protein